jgi:membrane protein implicated in regulation of membrane protease activity
MWIWLVVVLVAAIGELLTYDLFLAPVAVAAIVTAVVALVLPVTLQVGIFAGLSLLGILFLRPILKRGLGLESMPQNLAIGIPSHVVGRHGIVTQTVNALGGQIRIGQGEFWTARPFNPTQTLERGDVAEVMFIEGIAALVEPVSGAAIAPAIESNRPIKKGIAS